jgi:hypothetical protein
MGDGFHGFETKLFLAHATAAKGWGAQAFLKHWPEVSLNSFLARANNQSRHKGTIIKYRTLCSVSATSMLYLLLDVLHLTGGQPDPELQGGRPSLQAIR